MLKQEFEVGRTTADGNFYRKGVGFLIESVDYG